MLFIENKKIKIGLMGGSFNPAHDGHIQIACEAIKKLDLDEIWWLISPQNPLKSKDRMMMYEKRVEIAKKISKNYPKIKVKEIEKKIKTTYTSDLISFLKKRSPLTKFVWIMGADSFLQMSKWKNWEKIVLNVPLAVFDRPSYTLKALGSHIAFKYKYCRISQKSARYSIFKKALPAWVFFTTKHNFISSTRIRRKSLATLTKKK